MLQVFYACLKQLLIAHTVEPLRWLIRGALEQANNANRLITLQIKRNHLGSVLTLSTPQRKQPSDWRLPSKQQITSEATTSAGRSRKERGKWSGKCWQVVAAPGMAP
jgi:hypothetical protein